MSESRNTEDEGPGAGLVQRWFGGGGSWWDLGACVGVGAALYLWKMNRDLQKERQGNTLRINRIQRYIDIDNRINVWSAEHSMFNFLFTSEEESKKKQEKHKETVDVNKIGQEELRRLDEVEDLWVERQHLYCSPFKSRSQRVKLEQEMREIVYWVADKEGRESFEKTLKSDRTCGSCLWYLWTGDKRNNGGAMWEVLQELREVPGKKLKETGFENLLDDPLKNPPPTASKEDK